MIRMWGMALIFFVVVDILVSLDTFLYFFLSRQIDADGLDTGPVCYPCQGLNPHATHA